MKTLKLISFAFLLMMMNNLSVVAQNTANKSNKEAIAATIKTVELAVDGMTCQKGCADGIDKKFKTVSGVVKSKTKLDTGISTITFDESKIKLSQLISIIEDRGYTAKPAVKNKKV
jgi:copper chaperone